MEKRKLALAAFDLDGTLLDDKKNIPPENLRQLQRAAERGVLLVPATGRIPSGMPEELMRLPIRYGLLVNGAMLYDFERRETVARAEIPNARALEIIDFMDTLPISYDCYFHAWGYIDREKLARVEEYIQDPGILRLVHTLRTPVDNLRQYLAEQGDSVQKLQMYFRPETFPLRDQLLRELPARWPDISVTQRRLGQQGRRAADALRAPGHRPRGDCRLRRRQQRQLDAARRRPWRGDGERRRRGQGRRRHRDGEQQRLGRGEGARDHAVSGRSAVCRAA